MFDYEPPKEETPTDYSGLIIGLMTLPLLFILAYLGKTELGFTCCIVLAMVMVAIRLRWKLRKYVWFWATIVLILTIHIPFLFVVRWPQSNIPTIAYALPCGIADFLIISGAISLAEKLFSKGSPSDDEGE